MQILKVEKKTDSERRVGYAFRENKLCLSHFIPIKTVFDHPLYFIERDENTSSIWYPKGGGVQHASLKKFVDIDKVAEFLGFYFGDGTTCNGTRSLRLTNCEPSILNHCLDFCDEIGIPRTWWKVQVVYSTNGEITSEIKQRCIGYWSKILDVDITRIVSVTKSKNIRETIFYGSARLFIDSTVLVERFLYGLLNGVLKRISNPQELADYQLLKGFLRGLLAAEGSVSLNKNGSVVRVGIAFDPHSSEVDLYKILLKNLGITPHVTKDNELIIQKYINMITFYKMDAFKLHAARNQKFLAGFKNHRFFRYRDLE